MSTLKLKKEKLSNLFTCQKGNSKYIKTYCNKHQGDYEVYTGSTLKSFGFLNTYDYDEPNLSFTTDGEYAGTLKVLIGKYNVGGHRAILLKKDTNLDLDYFNYILQPIFYSKVKPGDVPSVSWEKHLKHIEIEIPIDKNGDYDIIEQRRIAEILKQIENKKISLQKKKNILLGVLINDNLLNDCKYKEVLISDIFSPENGSGEYTKTYCKNNAGDFPVYSGSSIEVFSNINSYDYDGEYLTWVKDGLAGYLMYHNEKFSITNHRGILIPKSDMSNIDLRYLKYIIEPIFRNECKGRVGHDGQNEYTTLNQTMINNIKTKIKIPVDNNGNYDLNKQKEIANKYRKIEEIKKNISNQIDILCSTEIQL